MTRRVFEQIARQRPRFLLVSGDGPRPDHPSDDGLVRETRAIFNNIDWPCELLTLFPASNRGCRRHMSDSITWVFEQFERAIILEDDCLPDSTFFGFCEQLLARFADDSRVMMISGDNFQPQPSAPYSYYFSAYSHIWGWASWRRAWRHFDLEMKSWPDSRAAEILNRFCCEQHELNYWTDIFDRQHAGQINTWDYAWAWACWEQLGLTVLPGTNLVSNIGFRTDATHTTDPASALANRIAGSLTKLIHPPVVARDTVADEYTWRQIFRPPPPPVRRRGPGADRPRRIARQRAA